MGLSEIAIYQADIETPEVCLMAPLLEDYIEDMALTCSRCAGEAVALIVINNEFVCLECAATRKRGACHE